MGTYNAYIFLGVSKDNTFSRYTFYLFFQSKLYTVCYECLMRSPNCALCPLCHLVYFCSKECNLKDIKNPASKHNCKLGKCASNATKVINIMLLLFG